MLGSTTRAVGSRSQRHLNCRRSDVIAACLLLYQPRTSIQHRQLSQLFIPMWNGDTPCVTFRKTVVFVKAGMVTFPVMIVVCPGNDHANAGTFASRSGLAKHQWYFSWSLKPEQTSTWSMLRSHPCESLCGEVSFWVVFWGLVLVTTG